MSQLPPNILMPLWGMIALIVGMIMLFCILVIDAIFYEKSWRKLEKMIEEEAKEQQDRTMKVPAITPLRTVKQG